MNGDPIVGVDREADLDEFRIRPWQRAAIAVVLLGGLASLIAGFVKTDTEQAAATLERYLEAVAAGEEVAACEQLTEGSQDLLVVAAERSGSDEASCEAGIAAAIERSERRGQSLPDEANLDPETIAENLELEGGRAVITGSALELEQVDGDWLVSLESGLGVRPQESGPL